MKITNEILRDLISCSYKAFNVINGKHDLREPEISTLYKRLKEFHLKRFEDRNKTPLAFSFNSRFENEHFDLTFDAIDRKLKSKKCAILTVPFEKITKTDKLFIAFMAHVVCKEFFIKISHCKIVYGEEFKTIYFKISTFKKYVTSLTKSLAEILESSRPPAFHKNEHCPFCKFSQSCMASLQERDDLSLLAGLKSKEVATKNNRGIFTVNQLSFTFRPKKHSHRGRNYRPELKALAIREKKTYIQEGWNVPRSRVEIFLDIEGIPERKFLYLIGIIIRTKDSLSTYSLWADEFHEQKQICESLLSILSDYDDFVVYHYGAYETQALASLIILFPEHQQFLERIVSRTFNVLSILSQYVYVPTYTNGLKEIARFLGFKWTHEGATGLQSIVWRYNWEHSRDEALKQNLLRYNIEDCKALMKVFDWLCTILFSDQKSDILREPKPTNFYKWGKTEYALNDFEAINEKAYFDYQRNHIVLRKNRGRVIRMFRRLRPARINKPTKQVSYFPLKCPNCLSEDLKLKASRRLHIDLVLSKTGVKSVITTFIGGKFECLKCGLKSLARDMRKFPKYSRNLMIWSVNQKIQYNLSSQSVINFLRDTVKIEVSPTQMTRFKEVIATEYKNTYKEILDKMISSNLIHVDETIAKIKGIEGYVWVFANHECVYYEFRKTRETEFLKTLLASFKGTLVSDFYAGYDSIPCPQQKCLVHLIRDLNADYLKNQFDEEFKFFVVEFSKVLRKIVSTIDTYGLQRFRLHKHLVEVKTFYRKVVNKSVESEIGRTYQKRFKKYRDKLFHFLTEDNIPWNNNNAEHSIKPFAKWRKQKSINLTIANIENHLILLSILQTCKYKGLSFFEFMKSGELSIFKYSERGTNHQVSKALQCR